MKLVATLPGAQQIRGLGFVPGTHDLVVHDVAGLQRIAIGVRDPVWRAPASGAWRGIVAIDPSGDRLLAIGDDEVLVERDAATGAERRRLAGEETQRTQIYATRALAFSGDGSTVLWGGSAVRGNPGGYLLSAVELRDASTLARRWRWEGRDWQSVSAAAFAHRGILVAESGHLLLRLDRDTGAPLKHLRVHAAVLASSRDAQTVVLGGDTTRVHRDGKKVGELRLAAHACAIDPAGRYAAVLSADVLTIITCDAVRVAATTPLAAFAERVACSDDGLVAVGASAGGVSVYAVDAFNRQ